MGALLIGGGSEGGTFDGRLLFSIAFVCVLDGGDDGGGLRKGRSSLSPSLLCCVALYILPFMVLRSLS